jgi:coenzyme F420-reducing hydrogenase alpha subunit
VSAQINGLVTQAGAAVNGEAGVGTVVAPDGTRTTPIATTNPGGTNNYELLVPTFTMPGMWYWHVVFTSPNVARQGTLIVDYSPAA